VNDKAIDLGPLEIAWKETLATTSYSPLLKNRGVRAVSIGIAQVRQAWMWSSDDNVKISDTYLENFIRRVYSHENPFTRQEMDAMLERIGANPIRDRWSS
jgi:hypothetical protein